jgi:hypothetical protein
MISRILATICAGAAALALGGCFVVQENTFGEALDETKSGAEITTRLLAAGGTARFGEVDVEVADRFVLLSGRVPSEADKIEAERIAWSVSSVDEVANELVVKKFDFGDALQDTWINTEVRARLLADSDIKKEKLFKLYKRFHTHVEGRGLGLYLIKSQIDVLHGTIEVESEPDRGTMFRITLPLKEVVMPVNQV